VAVDIGFVGALVVDVVVWTVLSAWCGWRAARRPLHRLDGGGPVRRHRLHRALGVARWKDRLPEAGTWFGGMSKRHLPPGRPAERLERFARESRRAELTHAWLLAATPVFALWNPPGLFAAMVGFSVVANVPCWLVARSNRSRCRVALARHGARRAR
jgi:glycosyl-4,4'-diaponeurosporenoate acyltransferase